MCLADCETSDLGAVVGRVSNGIAGATFLLNGTVYSVSDVTSGWHKVLCCLCLLCLAPPKWTPCRHRGL